MRLVDNKTPNMMTAVYVKRWNELTSIAVRQPGHMTEYSPAQARAFADALRAYADLLEPRVVPEIEGVPA